MTAGVTLQPSTWFARYLLPAVVFQGVLIGGGYGTGRELAEFFLVHGPLASLVGLCVTALIWAVILAIAFEFARVTGCYEYRAYFQRLIGKGWILFEMLYLLIVLVVFAVLGAAASEIFESYTSVDGSVGMVALISAICLIVYLGNRTIEIIFAFWSVLIYGTYILLFLLTLQDHGSQIEQQIATSQIPPAAFVDSVRYAGYNLAVIPAILFVLRHQTRRAEAIVSGGIAGLFGALPAIFMALALIAFYPEVVDQPVPVIYVIDNLIAPDFVILLNVVLFGTFVQTGVGILHAINERIAKAMPARMAGNGKFILPVFDMAFCIFAMVIADRMGVIGLVAKGYGILTYGFLAVVVLPLLTFGLWRIAKSNKAKP